MRTGGRSFSESRFAVGVGRVAACNVTKRQLMPPPCFSRHLRPCRAPWSAQRLGHGFTLRYPRQARYVSDKPAGSASPGGDASWPRRRQPNGEFSFGRRGDSVATDTGTPKSQAQRMREGLGAVPRLRIKKQLVSKESQRVQGAIETALKSRDELKEKVALRKRSVSQEKVTPRDGEVQPAVEVHGELQNTQEPGTSRDAEDELREKLRRLEEQLAVLRQRLEDVSTPTPTPLPTPTPTPTTTATPAPTPASTPASTPTPAPSAAQGNIEAKTEANTAVHVKVNAGNANADTTAAHHGQSLLDELFPEASSHQTTVNTHCNIHTQKESRPAPPKLDLPAPDHSPVRRTLSDTHTARDHAAAAFRSTAEPTTVLQLANCSTALTEPDFRRLVPRGRHIDSWARDGAYYHIIPGRDPVSLARLPFYYLLFRDPRAALAYQKNASRLSKLTALHTSHSIHSALPPPPGFLEDGEDLHAVTSAFVLHPHGHKLDLRTVMQPYNRALRALIDARGYAPIAAPSFTGAKVHRVLLHIDGYEPSKWDLWQTISRHAHAHGIMWSFQGDHNGVRKLRDVVNLRTIARQKLQSIGVNPRAAVNSPSPTQPANLEYKDPSIAAFLGTESSSDTDQKQLNQLVMNRLYNRWILDFDDEHAARRFAAMWHRVVLPQPKDKTRAWAEAEEVRWVEAEYLW